jgi:menaquinone-dependent protoporphyrinogen IX oxidase
MKKVLVAYGTRYGTTQDTSEKIHEFLATKEIEVSLVNLENNEPSLSGLDGVLIGTGIKINMWTKKIKKFIMKHKKELSKRNFKFGFFVNCGTASQKENINEAIEKYIDKKMQKIGLTYDIADAFGAIYDFSETSRLSKMNQKLIKSGLIKEEGWEKVENILYDLRDMDQIQKFAEDFVALL